MVELRDGIKQIQGAAGNRMIVIDNCQKPTVLIFASLANKWLRETKAKVKPPAPQAKSPAAVLDDIKKLGQLKDAGHLTDDEFTALKKKLLE